MLATIFTLFLVTASADVKHSQYDSLPACEEAKSLALYGKTVEQKKADDAAEAKRQAAWEARYNAARADDDAWRKAHPAGPATWLQQHTLQVGDEVKTAEAGPDDDAWYGADRRIDHERRPHWKTDDAFFMGSTETPVCLGYPSCRLIGIRFAECVIVPEAKP